METRADWQKIKELFGAALEREPPERDSFLREACGPDLALRNEVVSLLKAHDGSSAFLEQPLSIRSITQVAAHTIGPYQLIRKIGEGGMGQVWLAEQTSPIQRQVALKLIRWAMYDDALLRRFQAERQSLAVMDHPSIAKVFDAGATGEGQPYFVMEYVSGVPITDYCDQKKLKIRERLELLIKVCEGVQHAHQKAVIHRDLKPANILVGEVDGRPVPRIIDFGLAKAVDSASDGRSLYTRARGFVGTPGYMSPEQAGLTTQDVDTRTDVYSLGVLLYVLLTGRLPFESAQLNRPLPEMLRILREQDPPRPSTKVSSDRNTSSVTADARGTEPKQLISQLRGDLDWITLKAVEKDRTRRYSTASELAQDLIRYMRHEPVTARPASVSYRARKYVRRHRIGVAVGASIAALLVSFGVFQSIQLRRITRERDRADRIADFMTGIFRISDPSERVGNTVTARQVLDNAATDINTGLSTDPELQASMMHVIGKSYTMLGIYSRAESLYDNGIQLSTSAGNDREALKMSQELGWTLFQEGRMAEAEQLERRTIDQQRKELGPDDPDTLGTMGNLGVILCEENKCAEGVKLEEEVLQDQKRVQGPTDRYTIVTMDNLAVLYSKSGQLARAEELEKQALALQIRTKGLESLGAISSMMNLANFERDQGRDAEAQKAFQQALDLENRVLGPNQPDMAETKYDFATVLARDGQTDEALKFLREAVDHGLEPRIAAAMYKDPLLNSLHGDPRFVALVEHVKQRLQTPVPKPH
ncbi:MAG TPA: serine/threonine-protein kinase [Terriglobales bacterium]